MKMKQNLVMLLLANNFECKSKLHDSKENIYTSQRKNCPYILWEDKASPETMRWKMVIKTVVEVQRIALKIIGVMSVALSPSHSLFPLWLQLPNQLPQKIGYMATTSWCSSFNANKCDRRSGACDSLPQLQTLDFPTARDARNFHF